MSSNFRKTAVLKKKKKRKELYTKASLLTILLKKLRALHAAACAMNTFYDFLYTCLYTFLFLPTKISPEKLQTNRWKI